MGYVRTKINCEGKEGGRERTIIGCKSDLLKKNKCLRWIGINYIREVRLSNKGCEKKQR